MSYDLCFWRQTRPLELTPEQICDALALDEPVDGIASLPVEEIKNALLTEFPDIDDELDSMLWENDESCFRVWWPAFRNYISITCSYNLLENPDPLNRVIALMGRFGCALYDPQTGQRYRQPNIDPSDD